MQECKTGCHCLRDQYPMHGQFWNISLDQIRPSLPSAEHFFCFWQPTTLPLPHSQKKTLHNLRRSMTWVCHPHSSATQASTKQSKSLLYCLIGDPEGHAIDRRKLESGGGVGSLGSIIYRGLQMLGHWEDLLRDTLRLLSPSQASTPQSDGDWNMGREVRLIHLTWHEWKDTFQSQMNGDTGQI